MVSCSMFCKVYETSLALAPGILRFIVPSDMTYTALPFSSIFQPRLW